MGLQGGSAVRKDDERFGPDGRGAPTSDGAGAGREKRAPDARNSLPGKRPIPFTSHLAMRE